jgi:mRNA-degrading endonuclease RelE of RelBE toxin-antitoxin system
VAEYTVVFARSPRKELQSLDPPVALRILKSIEALVSGPRPAGARKLEGAADLWRIRVGEWRFFVRQRIGRVDNGRLDVFLLQRRPTRATA